MLEAYEQFQAFLNRAYLIEVFSQKGNRKRLEFFAQVAESKLGKASFIIRGSGEPLTLNYCGANLAPCRREAPFGHGWRARLENGEEFIFFELPPEPMIY